MIASKNYNYIQISMNHSKIIDELLQVRNVCKKVKNQHIYNKRKDFIVTIIELLSQ